MRTRLAPSVVCPAAAGGAGAYRGWWWFYGIP